MQQNMLCFNTHSQPTLELKDNFYFSESYRLSKKAYLEGRSHSAMLYAECCLKIAATHLAMHGESNLDTREILRPLNLLMEIHLKDRSFGKANSMLANLSQHIQSDQGDDAQSALLSAIGSMYQRLESTERELLFG